MRITYDPEANAAYIYFTDDPLMPGRDSMPLQDVLSERGEMVVMDWKDGKIVGLEVLGASSFAACRPTRSGRSAREALGSPSLRTITGSQHDRNGHQGGKTVRILQVVRLRKVSMVLDFRARPHL